MRVESKHRHGGLCGRVFVASTVGLKTDDGLLDNPSRPLSITSSGGRFYSFYVEDWQYQDAGYHHLLANGSTGLSIYHINPDSELQVGGSNYFE